MSVERLQHARRDAHRATSQTRAADVLAGLDRAFAEAAAQRFVLSPRGDPHERMMRPLFSRRASLAVPFPSALNSPSVNARSYPRSTHRQYVLVALREHDAKNDVLKFR